MTDQFAKTLVIDDPDYAPGDLGLPAYATKNQAPVNVKPEPKDAVDNTAQEEPELPDFEDTSWLT